MGSKNKLKRFRENATFDNVFQPKRDELVELTYPLKGHWHSKIFKNNNPLVLELGCGKGEYSVALAKQFPSKNFIGIDIKGARIWTGAKESIEQKLKNVCFIRFFKTILLSFSNIHKYRQTGLCFINAATTNMHIYGMRKRM